MSLAEVTGTYLGCILMLRCSILRRFMVLAVMLTIGGTACLASWALALNGSGDRGGWPLLVISLVDRVSIASSLALLSCGCSAELVPLPRRPLIILSLATSARLCLLSAPFINTTVKYGDNVPLSLYGVLTLMGATAAFYLTYALSHHPQGLLTLNMASTISQSLYIINKRPEIGSTTEVEIKGIHFNPCFINDSEV